MIETKLNEGQNFKAISSFLNKDFSTISKEVKNHLSFEKSGAYGKSFNDCLLAFQRKCSAQKVCPECSSHNNRPCCSCGKCSSSCILYEKYVCPKLSNPPDSKKRLFSTVKYYISNSYQGNLDFHRHRIIYALNLTAHFIFYTLINYLNILTNCFIFFSTALQADGFQWTPSPAL